MTESKQKVSMWDGILEKSMMILADTRHQQRIQQYVVDPILSHIMNRVFPYILLICVLFTLLLVVAMLTFAIVFIQMRSVSVSMKEMPGHVIAESFIQTLPSPIVA